MLSHTTNYLPPRVSTGTGDFLGTVEGDRGLGVFAEGRLVFVFVGAAALMYDKFGDGDRPNTCVVPDLGVGDNLFRSATDDTPVSFTGLFRSSPAAPTGTWASDVNDG